MDINSQILCFGEILWDVLPDKKVPGGAPMNVALHLKRLGMNVKFASRIGSDPLGKELKDYLDSIAFQEYLLQEDRNHPTGTVQVDLSDSNDPKYDIVFPSAWDYIEMTKELKQTAEGSELIVYGSLASRNEVSRKTLQEILDNHNTYNVLDINLRVPHYNKERTKILMNRADLVKMNEEELNILTNWFTDKGHDMEEADQVKLLSSTFDCPVVCVTKGGNGAAMLYEGNYYRHPGYQVEVADAVGSGDAFLAALLHGYLSKGLPEKMLDLACATGAFVASRSGGTPEYGLEEIEKIMRNIGGLS
ncbi:MAG: carbohydrate kinase [Bacteroidales bacterium]|nr:carbohydrate kinase [Bacteroidales bacterium]